MALCVNEHTRYAIVVPLMDCESILDLYILLAQRIYDAVRRVCDMDEVAGRILDEYRGGVLIARTNPYGSRQYILSFSGRSNRTPSS